MNCELGGILSSHAWWPHYLTYANACRDATTWVVTASTWHVICFVCLGDLFSFFLYAWDRAAPSPVDRFWRSIRQRYAYWGSHYYYSPFRGSDPRNTSFGDVKTLFQAQPQIIETCILSIKFALLQSPLSAYRVWPKYSGNKSQMADGRHLWKTDRFWWSLALWCILAQNRARTVKFRVFEIQNSGGRQLKNKKIATSRQRIDRSSRSLAWWCEIGLLTIQTVKKIYCRLTNYELLRWLVETPSRDFAHYRLSGWRRIFTTCQELTSWHVSTYQEVSSWHVVNILRHPDSR